MSDSFATPLTVAIRLFCPWDFPGKEWVPFPSPGDLPDSGTEPVSLTSPALAGRYFTAEPPGKCLEGLGASFC